MSLRPFTMPAPRRPRPLIFIGVTAAASLVLFTAAGVTACGDSTSSSARVSPAAPSSAAPPAAAPQPRPSPQITAGTAPTGAVAATREFWRLVGSRHFAEARAMIVPQSPAADPNAKWGIRNARLLAVYPDQVFAHPESYATVEFPVDVFVTPTGETAWGPVAARHRLWMVMTRMSDDTWLVYETGTSP